MVLRMLDDVSVTRSREGRPRSKFWWVVESGLRWFMLGT